MPNIAQQFPPVSTAVKSQKSCAAAKPKGAQGAAADFEETLASARAPVKKTEEESNPHAKNQTVAEKKTTSTKAGRGRKAEGRSAEKPAEAEPKPQTEVETKAPTEDPSADNAQPPEDVKTDAAKEETAAAKQCVAQAAQDAANIATQLPPAPVESKPADQSTSDKTDASAAPVNNDVTRIAKPIDRDIPQVESSDDKTIPNAAKTEELKPAAEAKLVVPADNANVDEATFEQTLKKLETSDQTEKQIQPVSSAAEQVQPPTVSLSAHVSQTNAPPVIHAAAPVPPEVQFADTNHPQMVTAMRTELLPNGGSMRIRLDPPSLGEIQVQVDMRDGNMTASFQTSNDEATRLLTHSLGQLRQSLELQGVSVEKLQVQQAPREQFHSNSGDEGSQQRHAQDNSSQQEQQRREMLQRMWRRLRLGSDPLDLVA